MEQHAYSKHEYSYSKLRLVNNDVAAPISLEDERKKRQPRASNISSDSKLLQFSKRDYQDKSPVRIHSEIIEPIDNPTETSEDFSGLSQMQDEFDRHIGAYIGSLQYKTTKEDLLTRSYNPVVDRWRVEKVLTGGNNENLAGLKNEIRLNMYTNIMERLKLDESEGEYSIKDGELYSVDFPNKSFSQVIADGAKYMAGLGSKEQEREGELGEIAGWRIINAFAINPQVPIGAVAYNLSHPGIVEGTNYVSNFVDKFIVSERKNGERYIKRVRVAVNWDSEKYSRVALSLDPTYFDAYDGRPIDAWFLSHVVTADSDVLHDYLEQTKNGMKRELFEEKIKNHPALERLIQKYESILYAVSCDWINLALGLNAILNCVDELQRQVENPESEESDGELSTIINSMALMSESAFRAAFHRLGTKQVEEKSGWGCPSNKGLDLSGGKAVVASNPLRILSNSVAKFGVEIDTVRKEAEEELEKDGYKFDKPGPCRRCEKESVNTGPCDLCRGCDIEIRIEEKRKKKI